jgi:hypothetical protein
MSVVSESASISASEAMTVAEIISATKHLTAADLFKLLKQCTAEAEKRTKSDAKVATKRPKKEKKEKGAVPLQLRKNHAWVAFTLKHAQENGWEEFVITKKDEEILMPASTTNSDGAYVYEDTITDKTPKGKQINRSEAMSLAKLRKDANHSSWEEFEAQYVPDETTSTAESSDETKSTTSSKKTVTRKTAAEKEAEKAAKEAEKAEKKAAKEKEKEEKKAAKEAEKAEKKAAKEKAEKKPATAVAKAAPAPKKAAGGAGAKAKASDSEAEAEPAPAPAKAVKKIAVKKIEEKDEKIPTVADDGQAHLVTWKGTSYYMMASGEAWLQNKDKSMGKWAGMFDATKNILDTTVEEPAFEDEE